MKIIITIVTIFILLVSFGCGQQQKPGEIKAALIEFDPSFKAVLDKKAQIDSQAETMKGEFRAKQGEINSKIMELEEELKAVRKELYAKIHDLNAQLDPERQKVNLKVEELKLKLNGKEARAASINSSIKNQKNLLDNKKLNLSPQEQSELQNNIEKAKQELAPLEEEVTSLRREIQLYRQESNLLKY
jgi:2,3-bisphosphoglycerate-independent phosphoglycerate mutase